MFVPELQSMRLKGCKSREQVGREGAWEACRKAGNNPVSSCGSQLRGKPQMGTVGKESAMSRKSLGNFYARPPKKSALNVRCQGQTLLLLLHTFGKLRLD